MVFAGLLLVGGPSKSGDQNVRTFWVKALY